MMGPSLLLFVFNCGAGAATVYRAQTSSADVSTWTSPPLQDLGTISGVTHGTVCAAFCSAKAGNGSGGCNSFHHDPSTKECTIATLSTGDLSTEAGPSSSDPSRSIMVVDAPWSQWSPAACSASCGGGALSRQRTCLASACVGKAAEVVGPACNTHACPGCPPMAGMSQHSGTGIYLYMTFSAAADYCAGFTNLGLALASISTFDGYDAAVEFTDFVKNKDSWVDLSNPAPSSCGSPSSCNNVMSDSAGNPVPTAHAFKPVSFSQGECVYLEQNGAIYGSDCGAQTKHATCQSTCAALP